MELKIFRHLWGVLGDGGPFALDAIEDGLRFVKDRANAAPHVKYAGIEHGIMMIPDRRQLADLLGKYELEIIPMVYTYGFSVEDHLMSFRMQLEWAKELPHKQINSHSGSDAFSEDDVKRFFSEALKMEKDLGVTVSHETHRGRCLFNPWVTGRMIEQFEDLKLTCDLSHWVVVSERLLDDQAELMKRCTSRGLHIHARLGHEHAPQVDDPASPRWSAHLAAFERWWDQVWDAQKEKGMATTTLVPEFGPPNYQPTFNGEPIGDRVAICEWMAARQRDRFAARK